MSDPAQPSTRTRLIYTALCVLDQTIDDCCPHPVKPNPGLRLALALLHFWGEGDRSPFDQFWRVVTAAPNAITRTPDTRATYARTYLSAICRQVGMPLSVDMLIGLRKARGLPTYERPPPSCLSPTMAEASQDDGDDPIKPAGHPRGRDAAVRNERTACDGARSVSIRDSRMT